MTTFTFVHVVISLVGIVSGVVVVVGLLTAKRLDGWTALYLATTLATSVTGFFFPFHGLKPAHVVGVLSIIVLGVAILARYRRHLVGRWRGVYVVSAVIALYFNVFVLIVQSFLKIPALHALAPTQTELPFKAVQSAILILFIVVGVAATKNPAPSLH